jgi:hypothetical protein
MLALSGQWRDVGERVALDRDQIGARRWGNNANFAGAGQPRRSI